MFARRSSGEKIQDLDDLERLKAGYGPHGKGDPETAFWREFLTGMEKQAGVRFGKYRFKLEPGQPHSDGLKITLTGRHLPVTFQRAALWSAKRHGIHTG